MYPSQRIRASDAEREATIAVLQTAATEGRLTLDEFGDRSRWASAATTRDELAALVADLPHPALHYPPVGPLPQQAAPLPLLALIFGVMSIPAFGCLPFGGVLGAALGVAAIVSGTVARRQIRSGAPGSKGMALAGVICGSLGVVLGVALVVVLNLLGAGSFAFIAG
jgi:hypothetical protein